MRFVKLPEVKRITSLGKTSIYGYIKASTFSAPVKIGGKAVAWIEDEIMQWVNAQILASRGEAALNQVPVCPILDISRGRLSMMRNRLTN